MKEPKNLIVCPQCTELRAPSYFIRQRWIDGQCVDVDEPFKTCKFCRTRGVRKARGENVTTWKPSGIELDKPEYWPVGNEKIAQAILKRIKSKG